MKKSKGLTVSWPFYDSQSSACTKSQNHKQTYTQSSTNISRNPSRPITTSPHHPNVLQWYQIEFQKTPSEFSGSSLLSLSYHSPLRFWKQSPTSHTLCPPGSMVQASIPPLLALLSLLSLAAKTAIQGWDPLGSSQTRIPA